MKRFRKTLGGNCLRRALIYFLAYCVLFNTSLPVVLATPGGWTFPAGPAATITQPDAVTTNVVVGGTQSVIQWTSLDTAGGDPGVRESLNFFDGSYTGAAVLNRVSGARTYFNGDLTADTGMHIFIVNPAGVVFGDGSTVNVTQLVASGLDVADPTYEDFLVHGRYEFAGGTGEGVVINESGLTTGGINATEGVVLIGEQVINRGIINTDPGGFVVMAAGDRVLLGTPGSKILVELDSVTNTDPGIGDVINESTGQINSPGGTVVLAAGDIFSIPLHPQLRVNSGTVEVPEYEVADQPVRVESGTGTVTQSGTINADGAEGSVVLTAGNKMAEDDDDATLDDDIPDVILSTGSITQAVGGEVITYAHDYGTKGTTAGAITSFEEGAVINVGTGTAEISGNHVLFAGSVNALPEGTIQVDPVKLTIADTMPVTGPELDTLYEEEHVEFYSQAGVNLDLAADELITVEYMADSDPVGEITGGSGDIYLRNVYADGGIYFEQEDETGHTGPRSSIRTEAYYLSKTVYRDGGNIYMDAGFGGIVAGDLFTGVKSQDKMSQPGEIILRTAKGGDDPGDSDIEVGTMRAEGASSTQVSAISGGNLIVNGNAESISQQTDNEDQSVFKGILCLIAEGDIHLNGNNYEVKSQGKGELVADIRISAGDDVYIGSEQSPATIKAESKIAQQGIATKSTAYIVIHAGRNDDGEIVINGQTYTPPIPAGGYLTDGDITAVGLNTEVDTSDAPTSSGPTETVWEDTGTPAENFFARIEINSDAPDLGPCEDCPKPPGLPPIPHIFIIGDDSFPLGWAVVGAPLDVLANDDNGGPLVDGIVSEHTATTGGGTLTEILDGDLEVIGFEYTPPAGAVFTWDGVSDYAEFTDTFTYKAKDSDGNESINTATVTITVTNILPTALGDSETIHMNTPGNPTSAVFDLTPFIGDPQGAPEGTLVIDPDGTPGTLTLAKGNNDVIFGVANVDVPPDTATYVPFEGYVGNDDFDYTVTDSSINYQGEPVTSATLEVTVENALPTGDTWLGDTHMDTSITDGILQAGSFNDTDGDSITIGSATGVDSDQNSDFEGLLTYSGTAGDNGTASEWDYVPNATTDGYVGDDVDDWNSGYTQTTSDPVNYGSSNADEIFEVELWDGQYDYQQSETTVEGYELFVDNTVGPDIYRAKVYGTGTVSVDLTNTLPTGDTWLGDTHMDTSITDGSLQAGSFTDAEDSVTILSTTGVDSDQNSDFEGLLTYGGTAGDNGTASEWDYVPNATTDGYVGDDVDDWNSGYTQTTSDPVNYGSSNADEIFEVELWDGQYDYTFDGQGGFTRTEVTGTGTVSVDLTNTLPTGDTWLGDTPMDTSITDGSLQAGSFNDTDSDLITIGSATGVDSDQNSDFEGLLTYGGAAGDNGTASAWDYVPNATTVGYVGDDVDDWNSGYTQTTSDPVNYGSSNADEIFEVELWDGQYDYTFDGQGGFTRTEVTGTGTVSVDLTNTLPTGDTWLGDTPMDTAITNGSLQAGSFSDADGHSITIGSATGVDSDQNSDFEGLLTYGGTAGDNGSASEWDYIPNATTNGYVGDGVDDWNSGYTQTTSDPVNYGSSNADEIFEVELWDGQYDYTFDGQGGFTRTEVTGTGTVSVDITNQLPDSDSWFGVVHMDETVADADLAVDNFGSLTITATTYSGTASGTLEYDGVGDDWTYNPGLPGYVGDDEDTFGALGYSADEEFTVELWNGQYDYTFDGEGGFERVEVPGAGTVSVDLSNVLPFAGDGSFLDRPAGVPINDGLIWYDLPDIFAEGEIDSLTITLLENGGTLNPDGTLTTALGGTVTLAPDGESFTYDPPSNSFLGPDSFTFEVWDGQKDYPIEGDPTNVTVSGTITVSFTSAPPPPPPPPSPVTVMLTPVAPIPEQVELEVSGCPALMAWVAGELGADAGSIQISIMNAMASTGNIQPCSGCARLQSAATILQDAGGVHVAALAQLINEFASSTAPPTEEQMASIADAIARNTKADSHYAMAGDYLDALAEYVGILNSEMGFSAEESIELVTNKYVAPLAEGDNVSLATYIAASLAVLVQ